MTESLVAKVRKLLLNAMRTQEYVVIGKHLPTFLCIPFHCHGLLLFVTLGGTLLRFHKLGVAPFWRDESNSYHIANLPLWYLWTPEVGLSGIHPPLFYTLQKAWFLFGTSEFAMRSLPAFCGVLSIPLVYAFAHRLAGQYVGLLSAALLATSPIHVQYSQEAKAYTFLGLLAILVAWFLHSAVSHHHWKSWPSAPQGYVTEPREATAIQGAAVRPWLYYAICATALAYSHTTGIVFIVIINIMVGLNWLTNQHRSWHFLVYWSLSNLFILLLFYYWLRILFNVSTDDTGIFFWLYDINLFDFSHIAYVIRSVYGQRFASIPLVDILFFVTLLVGLSRVWRNKETRFLFISVVVTPPVFLWAFSFWKPIYLQRILFWMTCGFVVILLSIGITAARSKTIKIGLILLTLFFQLFGLSNYFLTSSKPPWNAAAMYLYENAAPTDKVFYFPPFSWRTIRYYLRELRFNNEEFILAAKDYKYYRLPPKVLQELIVEQIPDRVMPGKEFWFVGFFQAMGYREVEADLSRIAAIEDRRLFSPIVVLRYRVCSKQGGTCLPP